MAKEPCVHPTDYEKSNLTSDNLTFSRLGSRPVLSLGRRSGSLLPRRLCPNALARTQPAVRRAALRPERFIDEADELRVPRSEVNNSE